MSLSRIAATYSAAADHFDALPFWERFGRATVERLGLRPGARVLDLCCGTGASALPAAARVGPAGSVLGIDITEALLAQARAKAGLEGLANVTFRNAPVERLAFPPASFDAVLSVFGLFFVQDMAGLLARAWEWLAPGGVLAITTWGEEVLSPGEALFREAVLAEDPSLETPEAFWPVIMGTSNRAAFDALSPETRLRVRRRVTDVLRARGVRATRMDVLYALARRGGGH